MNETAAEGPWQPRRDSRPPAAPLSRVARRFASAAREHRAALIGYLTGYDGGREASLQRILAACDAGLDILELGVPWAFPKADGPVIRASMERALEAGATLERIIELAAAVRARSDVAMVLFSYVEPLLPAARWLPGALTAAGIDGVLSPNATSDHALALRVPVRERAMEWVGMCPYGASPQELTRALSSASGFAYVVSVAGVTGTPIDASCPALHQRLANTRARTSLPVAVGFGVRRAEQVSALAPHVDGVVVGSALVETSLQGARATADYVRELRAAGRMRIRQTA